MQLDQLVHVDAATLGALLGFMVSLFVITEGFRRMQAFKFVLQLLTAFLEGRILDIVLKIIDEVHDFALENLHPVHYFVELDLILDD